MTARENPFASCRVERLAPRLRQTTWPELFERFADLGRRAAIIGPHGSGKTTLVEEFGRRWSARGGRTFTLRLSVEYPQLPPGAESLLHPLAPTESPTLILLDGAEQLSWWAWRRFLARLPRETSLLITTHSAGRLPTLHRCDTSPELLHELIAELLTCPTTRHRPTPGAQALFDRHRGNLREALRELYDHYATIGSTEPWPAQVQASHHPRSPDIPSPTHRNLNPATLTS